MIRHPLPQPHRAWPFAALLLLIPSVAYGTELSLKLEPALAIPLSKPQSDRFDVGGGESVKALIGLTPWLDIGPTASFHLFPASPEYTQTGAIWAFGGGLRVKRPHDAEGLGGISPWLDADAFFVLTGDLARPGFDAAVGLAVPVGEQRRFWIGPFARYLHVGQTKQLGFDEHDAKTLTFGASLEISSGRKTEPTPVVVTSTCPACDTLTPCPDSDKDGVPDLVDRCPQVPGTLDDYGCPYKKVVVRQDKLELKEKLYFAWDEATLEPASYPILDEVAQALKDNPNFRVQIQGHADSSGAYDHNQTLSEARATTVLDYLASRGVARSRLVATGFSSSVPVDTNVTAAGRENNRRVEFAVSFIILNDGSPQ